MSDYEVEPELDYLEDPWFKMPSVLFSKLLVLNLFKVVYPIVCSRILLGSLRGISNLTSLKQSS